MRILVCIKQVPSTDKVEIDPKTGVIMRAGLEGKLNPYDEYAVETALNIRAAVAGSTITALTMGTPDSEAILREAYAMGVDEAILLTDRALAGSDVLATSYALSQAIRAKGPFDIIICGRQTTDGDTAQVGPALAEQLGMPHVSWVRRILNVNERRIVVEQDMLNLTADAEMGYPCLITVEKGIFRPRLPSYRLMVKTRDRPIARLGLADLVDTDPAHYGLNGSPTQVERIFPPEMGPPPEMFTGSGEAVAARLYDKLVELKLLVRE